MPKDLSSEVPLRFTHRRVDDLDLYFISNPADSLIRSKVAFRVKKDRVQIWDPLNVTRRSVSVTPAEKGDVSWSCHLGRLNPPWWFFTSER